MRASHQTSADSTSNEPTTKLEGSEAAAPVGFWNDEDATESTAEFRLPPIPDPAAPLAPFAQTFPETIQLIESGVEREATDDMYKIFGNHSEDKWYPGWRIENGMQPNEREALTESLDDTGRTTTKLLYAGTTFMAKRADLMHEQLENAYIDIIPALQKKAGVLEQWAFHMHDNLAKTSGALAATTLSQDDKMKGIYITFQTDVGDRYKKLFITSLCAYADIGLSDSSTDTLFFAQDAQKKASTEKLMLKVSMNGQFEKSAYTPSANAVATATPAAATSAPLAATSVKQTTGAELKLFGQHAQNKTVEQPTAANSTQNNIQPGMTATK